MSRESNLTQLWLKWVESELSRVSKFGIWIESELSQLREFKCWIESELNHLCIVTWVRVESARKIWVEHNPEEITMCMYELRYGKHGMQVCLWIVQSLSLATPASSNAHIRQTKSSSHKLFVPAQPVRSDRQNRTRETCYRDKENI